MDASPWPPEVDPSDSQLASVLIDHVQSRAVAIVSAPWPPVAANADGALLTLTWHFSAVGAVRDVVVLLHARNAAAPAIASPKATVRSRHRIFQPDVANACASPRAGARKRLKAES